MVNAYSQHALLPMPLTIADSRYEALCISALSLNSRCPPRCLHSLQRASPFRRFVSASNKKYVLCHEAARSNVIKLRADHDSEHALVNKHLRLAPPAKELFWVKIELLSSASRPTRNWITSLRPPYIAIKISHPPHIVGSTNQPGHRPCPKHPDLYPVCGVSFGCSVLPEPPSAICAPSYISPCPE